MKHLWLEIVAAALLACTLATRDVVQSAAQAGRGSAVAAAAADGPYARIAIMRPLDGHFVDFEAAYIRHLAWHQQARDPWAWYGWTVNYSERRMWFVYASFGHSAASLDNPVDPAGDDRDNVMNVAPHVDHWGNALYEFLPALSRGTPVPQPTPRLELTTVDLNPGTAAAFEAALGAAQSALHTETLWYRMLAGGAAPRYIRLRPGSSLSAILDNRNEQALPDKVNGLVANTTIEILNLRPTMCYGVSPVRE
jgi:hypothetical protein